MMYTYIGERLCSMSVWWNDEFKMEYVYMYSTNSALLEKSPGELERRQFLALV